MNIPEIRQTLENERRRLTTELELYTSPSSNVDRSVSPFNKKLEAASEITEMEQRLAKVRHIQQQITDLEHALQKVDNGTYGICDNCGKPIAEGRLKAIPQASLCLGCKAQRSRTLSSSMAR